MGGSAFQRFQRKAENLPCCVKDGHMAQQNGEGGSQGLDTAGALDRQKNKAKHNMCQLILLKKDTQTKT